MALRRKNAIMFILIIMSIGIAGLLIFETMNSNHNISQNLLNVSRIELVTIAHETVSVPVITSEIPVPLMPEKMMVYTIQRTISEEDFKEIAKNFGIAGEINKEDRFIVVRNESYQLDAEPSLGILNYKKITPQQGYDSDYIEKFLPRDQDARQTADEFLDLHKMKPADAKFSKITHSVGYLSTDPPRKYSESINVDYLHEVDNYPVLTDQLTVKIGVNGEIMSIYQKWIVPEPYREYSIITPADAYQYLQEFGVVIPEGINKPEEAVVDNISLGYVGETQAGNLDYLIPVYLFEGIVYGEGNTTEFYQWIPAIPEFTEHKGNN